MRSGWGSLSRIRVCSVEGPRGAKLGEPGEVDRAGDGGRDDPLPSPCVLISPARLVMTLQMPVPSRNSASGESSSITFSMLALPHCAVGRLHVSRCSGWGRLLGFFGAADSSCVFGADLLAGVSLVSRCRE